jgi:hypothetical protein
VTVDTVSVLAAAALIVGLLALLLALWLVMRTMRLAGLSAFRPQMPADLQTRLDNEIARADRLSAQVQDLATRLPVAERQSSAALQRVGIVRYNPFADTGGQQSFAVALLDSRGSGFVISSLHSRQATRIYLKQVIAGRSDTALSAEESEAIRQALGGGQAPAAEASPKT